VLTCLVIPHFDHLDQFRKVLPELVKQGFPLVVVDDASPQPSFDALALLLEEYTDDSILIRHPQNQGKGGAVITGLKAAKQAGFSHALQIDADGQHDIKAIRKLVAEAAHYPENMICGQPVFDDTVSRLRFYSRYLTLVLVWLETLSTEIRDALCGFRLYPLEQTMMLLKNDIAGKRMAFDPEILVRAVWAGIPLTYIPVDVAYPEDGKSHFRYFRDNLEISWMHTRLIFGMLTRAPMLIRRNLSRRPASLYK
jgi:glycosyltransferase involved in cell wall biosynthesis